MQLSIREASQFFIGAALMRAKTIEASGNKGITIDNVALAALRAGADGEKLRLSIATLAENESSWLRSTPPHALKTGRVMQSRELEIRAFTAIHAAVIATIDQAPQSLHDRYIDAFRAIEATPGSTQDKRQLKSLLREQALAGTDTPESIESALKNAEKAYLEANAEEILSRYTTLPRSSDFDI